MRIAIAIIMLFSGAECFAQIRILLLPWEMDIATSYYEAHADFQLQVSDIAKALEASQVINALVEVSKEDNRYHQATTEFGSALQKTLSMIMKKNEDQQYLVTGRLANIKEFVFFEGAVYKRRGNDQVESVGRLYYGIDQATVDSLKQNPSEVALLSDVLIANITMQLEALLEDKIRVMVAGFKYSGNSKNREYLARSIPELIASRIGISQQVRVITVDAVPHLESVTPIGEINPYIMPRRGRVEVAKYLITGSIADHGGALTISVTDVDLETRHTVTSYTCLIDSVTANAVVTSAQKLGDQMRRGIEMDYLSKHATRHRIAVVAMPPHPQNMDNRQFSRRLVNSIRNSLSIMSIDLALDVVENVDLVDYYLENQTDISVIGRDLAVKYLVVIRYERPNPEAMLTLSFHDVTNPRYYVKPDLYFIDHSDVLLNDLDDWVKKFLNRTAVWISDLTDTTKQRLGRLRHRTENWGVRFQRNIIGVLNDSKATFLGNDMRVGLDIAVITYLYPHQVEFTMSYDNGELSESRDVSVRGLYFSSIARQNFMPPNFALKYLPTDARLYANIGLMAMFVRSRTGDEVVWKGVPGVTFGIGVEIPTAIWRPLFLDFHVNGIWHVAGRVHGINANGINDVGGRLNGIRVGFGVGYKF